jgi:hypothetical protein
VSRLGFFSMNKPSYLEALERVGVLPALANFEPCVAGTPPLGLDLPMSDVDILCHAPDPHSFAEVVWAAFSQRESFAIWQWTGAARPVVCSFTAEGWVFELFGDVRPVHEQSGWRHFNVEKRLLALGGNPIQDALMRRRRTGMKTEPAFADALNLGGNPYQALLDIELWPDSALSELLAGAQVYLE